MSSSSSSTPSSCTLMLTTPPEEQCPALPPMDSSPFPPRTSSSPENSQQTLCGSSSVGSNVSRSSSKLSLSSTQQQMPDLVPNDEMNGIHGPHQGLPPGKKEGTRRRRPPSPLKGFETYSTLAYQSCNSSMSTPGSHASAVPVTPHTLGGEGSWLTSDVSGGTVFSPFGNTQLEFPDLARKVKDITRSPQFVNDATIGHHLLISDIPTAVTKEEFQLFISDLTPYRAILVRHLDTHGFVILCFYDSRDTMKVYNKLLISSVRFNHTLGPVSLQCTAIPKDLVRTIDGGADDFYEKVWKESDTCIDVIVKGPVTVAGVKTILGRMGDLRQFRGDPAGTIFRAEYFDARAAAKAVQVLDGAQIGDFKFTVRYASDREGDPFLSRPISPSTLPQSSSAPQYTFASAAYGGQSSGQTYVDPQLAQYTEAFRSSSNASRTPSRFARSFSNSFEPPHTQPSSPTVRSTFSRTHSVSAGTADWARITRNGVIDEPRHQNQIQASRWSDPILLQSMLDQMGLTARAYQQTTSVQQAVAPHNPQAIPVENVIHRDRILNGLDKRTAVMIKDVPNKLSREELVSILRDVVPNEFDFVYLRFDFNNHCNVGYAFVNFTSIQALLTFVEHKAGRKWNMFASEKVLQVSYANIQGKSSLITKFRNSHVMDALEEWRPQIFYSDGALKGQPEPFPEADHPARHHQRGSFSRAAFATASSGGSGAGSTNGYDTYRQATA